MNTSSMRPTLIEATEPLESPPVLPQQRHAIVPTAPTSLSLSQIRNLQEMLRAEEAALDLDDHARLRRLRGAAGGGGLTHNEVWREKVSEWFYRIVDRIGESREVAFAAMSLLDRYLALESAAAARRDRRAYQALAMTALLLATKLCGKVPFGARDLLSQGRGNVDGKDLSSAVKAMIGSLSWRSRVPAPASFVRQLVRLLPASVGSEAVSSLLDDATHLVEVSVCDSFFSGLRPSAIAYAAVRCAMDCDRSQSLSPGVQSTLLRSMEQQTGLRSDCPGVRSIYSKLRSIYVHSADGAQKGVSGDSAGPNIIPCDDQEAGIPSCKLSPISGDFGVVSLHDDAEESIDKDDLSRSKRKTSPEGTSSTPRTKKIKKE